MAVRPQQHSGYVQFLADIDDMVDPIRPACHQELAGLVAQWPAAGGGFLRYLAASFVPALLFLTDHSSI